MIRAHPVVPDRDRRVRPHEDRPAHDPARQLRRAPRHHLDVLGSEGVHCGDAPLEVLHEDDRAVSREGAPGLVEWAYVPAALPATERGQRLAVRLASATHHVTGIAAPSVLPTRRYELRDENELRSLPLPGGGSRSLYAADGLVRGTERAERFLFWPMGIASAGAMRQWSHHATAFVGRRHFDDPNLLDNRFLLPVSPTP